jgi:hypothetical protein
MLNNQMVIALKHPNFRWLLPSFSSAEARWTARLRCQSFRRPAAPPHPRWSNGSSGDTKGLYSCTPPKHSNKLGSKFPNNWILPMKNAVLKQTNQKRHVNPNHSCSKYDKTYAHHTFFLSV